MALFIFALVILLLTAELATFTWVAETIGWWDAAALSLLVSLVGIWLTKRAGLGAARRIRQASDEGRIPSREVADGALILLAGLLLLVPGFVTDGFGVALLLPPVRAGVRLLALARFRRSRHFVVVHGGGGAVRSREDVWEAESWEEHGPPPGPGEIGGPR